jgi:Phosphotransferase enzyme family
MSDSVLSAVVRLFFPTGRPLRMTAVGMGHINDTYRVDIEEDGNTNCWLLQRLNHEVFRKPDRVTDNILAITSYLGAQDYPYFITTPVAGLDGRFLQRDPAGNYWRVFPFLKNTHAPEFVDSPATAFEAARAYGAFARALCHFPAKKLSETIPGFHDTAQRRVYFEEILKTDPVGRVATAGPEIENMMRCGPLFDRIDVLKKSGALPLRATHNDTKAGNVLLDCESGKAAAVIDLDTVMPGTILSDYGDMVRTFVPNVPEDWPVPGEIELRMDILDALDRGFLSETAEMLTQTERDNLQVGARWITGEQALRFLSDHLAGDVYYKTKYPGHNLVRARNQLAVFDLLSKINH